MIGGKDGVSVISRVRHPVQIGMVGIRGHARPRGSTSARHVTANPSGLRAPLPWRAARTPPQHPCPQLAHEPLLGPGDERVGSAAANGCARSALHATQAAWPGDDGC